MPGALGDDRLLFLMCPSGFGSSRDWINAFAGFLHSLLVAFFFFPWVDRGICIGWYRFRRCCIWDSFLLIVRRSEFLLASVWILCCCCEFSASLILLLLFELCFQITLVLKLAEWINRLEYFSFVLDPRWRVMVLIQWDNDCCLISVVLQCFLHCLRALKFKALHSFWLNYYTRMPQAHWTWTLTGHMLGIIN